MNLTHDRFCLDPVATKLLVLLRPRVSGLCSSLDRSDAFAQTPLQHYRASRTQDFPLALALPRDDVDVVPETSSVLFYLDLVAT